MLTIKIEDIAKLPREECYKLLEFIPECKTVYLNNVKYNISIKDKSIILNDILWLINNCEDNWVRFLGSKKYRCICNGYIDWINYNVPVLHNKQYKLKTKVYWLLNNITDFPKCKNKNCKYLHFLTQNVSSVKYGYQSQYCCPACALASEEHQNKMHKLAQEKYGVSNILSSPQRIAKLKNTLKKHAEEDPLFWDKRNEKSKLTWLKNYNVDNPNKDPKIHQKIIESSKITNNKRYGVDFPLLSKEIIKKIKQTNLERYGVERTFLNKELQQYYELLAWSEEAILKRTSTLLTNYNITNAFQIQEIADKALRAIILKFFEKLSKSTISFNFTIDEYLSAVKLHKLSETVFSFHCKECGQDFLAKPFENYYNYSCVRCFNCHPKIVKGTSSEEKDLLKFVATCIDRKFIICNDKSTLRNPNTGYPLELDVWIPTLNKAIEFNGDYWHSLPDRIERDIIKNQQCKDKNIKLLTITETLWLFKNNEIKDIIRNFLK